MTTQTHTAAHRPSPSTDRTTAERQRRFRERQKEKAATVERERDNMMESIKYSQSEIKHLSNVNSELTNLNESLNRRIKLIRVILEEIRQTMSPTERTAFEIQMNARGLTEALKQD